MGLRKRLWNILSNLYPYVLRKLYKMDLGEGVRVSYKAKLDKSINPKGIKVGDDTWILANSVILAHDYCQGRNGRGKFFTTSIGRDCVIGINAIILPGVTIGNEVVVGAGSIVTMDIPSNSIVVGNPARVIKSGIKVFKGQIVS
ncbi:MAG: DapH/DapD/GlmU-related protein [Bacteroidales bacterium]|nr:DapH/DapD/GlmU-related protein [Bacteroidales bacterium]MDY3101891.1 DapH/DapD/GlmU-related protein [Porphyromonas sp.]